MTFRAFKKTGMPVVRIGGILYRLDMQAGLLQAVYDPEDRVDLEAELEEVR